MKKLVLVIAATMLSSTLALAQTTTNNTTTTGADNSGSTTKRMDKGACAELSAKARNGGTDWSDAQAKPYIDKMTGMKMSTKTQGKLTDEEFMEACQNGVFEGME